MAEYHEYQDYDEYYDEPSGGNRTWLVVAVVILVALLCCCCLALVAVLWLFGQGILDGLQGLASVSPGLSRVIAGV
jgi:hypothetical protein